MTDDLTQYRPFVRRIALTFRRRLRTDVDLDDLIQEGFIGLMDAQKRYDPSQGKFTTFAMNRVRGAMLDRLNAGTQRSIRRTKQHAAAAEEVLTQTTHRHPCREDVAAAVGLDVLTFDRLTVPEQMLPSGHTDPVEPSDEPALRRAIAQLPIMERAVLEGMLDERSQIDLAKALGLSPSRINQIYTKAVSHLRRLMIVPKTLTKTRFL